MRRFTGIALLLVAACVGGDPPLGPGVEITVTPPPDIELFEKPFVGEFRTGTLMDHDVPMQFVDANGVFTPFWGEVHASTGGMIDGHSGYDWMMPTGTPILAAGSGTVRTADVAVPPFFCPLLNKTVSDQASITILHPVPGTAGIVTRYLHMSRVDVTVGEAVVAGDTIGLAGSTGCSTAPHLHFDVYRMASETAGLVTDPFGWSGTTNDPWAVDSRGTGSSSLWKPGRAPRLWREVSSAPNPFGTTFPVTITRVIYEGVRDDINPNNEAVDLSLDTRVSDSTSLAGYRLTFRISGANVTLPATSLTTARPTLRVYVGSGAASATAFYMGRSAGILPNVPTPECVRLIAPTGPQYVYALWFSSGCAGGAAARAEAAFSVPQAGLDMIAPSTRPGHLPRHLSSPR